MSTCCIWYETIRTIVRSYSSCNASPLIPKSYCSSLPHTLKNTCRTDDVIIEFGCRSLCQILGCGCNAGSLEQLLGLSFFHPISLNSLGFHSLFLYLSLSHTHTLVNKTRDVRSCSWFNLLLNIFCFLCGVMYYRHPFVMLHFESSVGKK